MKKQRGTPVWEHLPNGKRRRRWLKREHVCTDCLRISGRFSWCARFSYRPEADCCAK